VQELVELAGLDPSDRLLARDEASPTMSTTMRSAATAVRLPVRVWRV